MYADHRTAGQMFNPPRDTSNSQFAHFPAEFERWAYTVGEDTNTRLGEAYYGLRDVLKDLRASTREEDWKFWKIVHGDGRRIGEGEQTYWVDGQRYRVSI